MPIREPTDHLYLPVSERNYDWGLYVTGAGATHIEPDANYPPRGHPAVYDFDFQQGRTLPEYAFVFIEAGGGEFVSQETGLITIGTNTLFILLPDVWHSYRPSRESGWTEHWITLNGSYLDALTQRGVLSARQPILNPKTPDTLLHTFNRMLQMMRIHPAQNRPVYAALAMLILAEAVGADGVDSVDESPAVEGEGTHFAEEIVESAMSFIWNWSHRHITVAEIADTLGVHRRTLENYFRKVRGTTASAEIQQCRIERACRLLVNTQMPIKRIATAAGFSNAEHLSKAFRRQLGTSPSEYRSRRRGASR